MSTRFIAVIFVFVLFAWFASGALGKKPGGDPEPCDGSPIEVYNSNFCGLSMWITATDSATVCKILCQTNNKRPGRKCGMLLSWIGGTVVADEGYVHGFYFEPSTVIVAEITAEGMQTNICQISNNPGFYDGGLWYIPAGFEETRPY